MSGRRSPLEEGAWLDTRAWLSGKHIPLWESIGRRKGRTLNIIALRGSNFCTKLTNRPSLLVVSRFLSVADEEAVQLFKLLDFICATLDGLLHQLLVLSWRTVLLHLVLHRPLGVVRSILLKLRACATDGVASVLSLARTKVSTQSTRTNFSV